MKNKVQLMNHQVDEITSWWNNKLMNHQVDEPSSWWNMIFHQLVISSSFCSTSSWSRRPDYINLTRPWPNCSYIIQAPVLSPNFIQFPPSTLPQMQRVFYGLLKGKIDKMVGLKMAHLWSGDLMKWQAFRKIKLEVCETSNCW